MLQVALVLVCLVFGIALRRSKRFPKDSARALNAYVIWISLPAVVLVQVPKLTEQMELSFGLWIPLSMAWILFVLSALFFSLVGRAFSWSKGTIGALTLTAGLGNTSFVGLPLLEALLGKDAVPIGVLVDQPGTFLVLATLGVWTASLFGRAPPGGVTAKGVLYNVVTFPPFIALILAFIWILMGLPGRAQVVDGLDRLAQTLVPIALVAVGFQLHVSFDVLRRRARELSLGLGFKLVAAPLFFYGLYYGVVGARGFLTQVTLLEAAMAPMITASVVATEFECDSELANLMVGVGIPLSLITVPFWHLFLS
jgi:predicted permease